MKIVKIKWRDSKRYIDQVPKDEKFTVSEIETVGFLVDEEKNEHYILAQDIIDDEYRGVIVIPFENVLEVKNL